MSNSAILVTAIKTRLKAQRLSYRELGKLVGISEPTVKRDLARGNFSLQRLDKSKNQLVSVLLKLDRLRIIDFRSLKRIRKLTARNFSWRKDGAVQAYSRGRVRATGPSGCSPAIRTAQQLLRHPRPALVEYEDWLSGLKREDFSK